mmetsp:Transcript_68156/g.102772  ORF Transcript_68156/g.102772 Transcript_68156/m.102772 type:complete len:91 (+) Transcript_68156:1-273(+)
MASLVVANPSIIPLIGFIASSCIIVSGYAGMYSSIVPYEADIFGQKYVSGIHGRLLLINTFGATFGPAVFLHFRNKAEMIGIKNLLANVD